jgi:hypothetical protein
MTVATLLLASCDSKHPLSDAAKAKADARLIGAWRLQDDQGDVQFCHIGQDEHLARNVYRAIWIGQKADKSLSRPLECIVFPTTIKDNTYLNVGLFDMARLAKADNVGFTSEQIETYLLFQYEIQGDTVLLRSLNPEAVKKAIETGKVKGTIPKMGNATFTDTPEHLAALVADNSATLFPKVTARYQRVK